MLHQQLGKHALAGLQTRSVPCIRAPVKSRRSLSTRASVGTPGRIAIVDYGVKSQRGTVRKVGVGMRSGSSMQMQARYACKEA
eukprot:1157362-Pelagomonas_calceolata.AAC.1